ncbi:hypothetical protein B0T10DRAFT_103495 [Thelonectria olida]|uniref:Uncharacterized protein n=1 Tax=Thelonectria olida TaxID=1576542 RepID=A0A9P8WF07_9HYPO|nr:hypothetical protein B0T10DRAFT_103495 [Thelonectria olida]
MQLPHETFRLLQVSILCRDELEPVSVVRTSYPNDFTFTKASSPQHSSNHHKHVSFSCFQKFPLPRRGKVGCGLCCWSGGLVMDDLCLGLHSQAHKPHQDSDRFAPAYQTEPGATRSKLQALRRLVFLMMKATTRVRAHGCHNAWAKLIERYQLINIGLTPLKPSPRGSSLFVHIWTPQERPHQKGLPQLLVNLANSLFPGVPAFETNEA